MGVAAAGARRALLSGAAAAAGARGRAAPLPAAAARRVRRQRLSDVSLSFPWIEAFPALAWTRSPGEALGYVARRVVRDREATAMRELASGTEPGLSAGERRWLGVSQAERIVRWALSQPPRPLTMRAVRSSRRRRRGRGDAPQPSTSFSTSAVFSRISASSAARLDVEPHQRLGVGAAQVEAPVRRTPSTGRR